MSRLTEATPQDIPEHDHHPTGRCKGCIMWSPERNPNFGLCLALFESTNADWSCLEFEAKPASGPKPPPFRV